jgi:hypothetical protein
VEGSRTVDPERKDCIKFEEFLEGLTVSFMGVFCLNDSLASFSVSYTSWHCLSLSGQCLLTAVSGNMMNWCKARPHNTEPYTRNCSHLFDCRYFMSRQKFVVYYSPAYRVRSYCKYVVHIGPSGHDDDDDGSVNME